MTVNSKVNGILAYGIFTAVAPLEVEQKSRVSCKTFIFYSIEHVLKAVFLYNDLKYLFSLVQYMQLLSVSSGTRPMFFFSILSKTVSQLGGIIWVCIVG